MKPFDQTYPNVLEEISSALKHVDQQPVQSLINVIDRSDKVFVVGVGRVMLSLQAFAKRLNHLGIQTHCVGDINEPAITDKDLLIVGSASGESLIPTAIAKKAKQFNATIAHIGSNPKSSLSPITDVFVRIPVNTKLHLADEVPSQQIMTSLFEQCLYVFGDTLAWMIAEKRGFEKEKLWRHHANLE